jgi:hypothetical protein
VNRTLEIELRGAVGRLADGIEAGKLPPELLFEGPAGTGKTWGILLCLHLLSLRKPGLRLLIARKTRKALTESVLVTFEKEVLPMTGHARMSANCGRQQRHSYLYPNGTEWIVGGLDRPEKILSTSYDLAYCNEAIELDEEDVETLQSRIGRPDRSHDFNCLILDTNPGDSAHWLKQRIDKGLTPAWKSFHRDNPGLHDGKNWTEAGNKYLARLGNLTASRRRRLFEGLWAVGEGAWFDGFDTETHVSEAAKFDADFPLILALDSGVHTGAVWFQVKGDAVTVCGDFYSFNKTAYQVGCDVIAKGRQLFNRDHEFGWTDPAGKAQNPIGPTVLEEYERAGLVLDRWPVKQVLDGLAKVESLVSVTPPRLHIHPTCNHLIGAFSNYKRAQRQGQWIDRPEDPQHPHEDLMDALRGGLMAELGGAGASWGDDPLADWRG